MPAGRNTAALLQKVNSQLRGERVPLKTKEEDELAAYLSSLTQKTQTVKALNYEEYGDISISSGADALHSSQGRPSANAAGAPSPAANKFLKKKKPPESATAAGGDFEDNGGHITNKGIVLTGKQRGAGSQATKASALEKAQALTNKIRGKAATGYGRDVSGDSDSEVSIRPQTPLQRPGSADTSVGRDGPKFLKGRKLIGDESAKPDVRSPSPQMVQRSSSVEKKKKSTRGSKTKGEIVRTLGNVYLTSEEESLAEFIHGLSQSDSVSKRRPNLVTKKEQKWRKKETSAALRKSPSPALRSRSPSPFKQGASPLGKLSRSQSQDSDFMDSMASEIAEDHHGQGGVFGTVNLMDVDNLMSSSDLRKSKGKTSKTKSSVFKPAPFSVEKTSVAKPSSKNKKKPLKKSDSKSSLFDTLGIHMVDELLDVNALNDDANDIDISDGSEIKTEHSDDRRKLVRKVSESEIITDLGASRSRPLQRQRSYPSLSISEKIGTVKRQDSKTSWSNENTDDEYSDSFFSDSEDKSVTPRPKSARSTKSGKKQSQRRKSNRSVQNESRSERKRDHKIVMEKKSVDISVGDPRGGTQHINAHQTGISLAGIYDIRYTDPKPVATHVVNVDTLEALTSYTPSMMALHEMMKAQLDLVQNFVAIQNRIYHSCMDGLTSNFKYTTLEDTKQYIEENRKPKMNFKEALKLVEQEEGVRA